MAVIVEFTCKGERVEAKISNGKWSCASPDVQRLLLSSLKSLSPKIGHHEPDPDFIIAETAVKELSFLEGRIIHADPLPESLRGPQGM